VASFARLIVGEDLDPEVEAARIAEFLGVQVEDSPASLAAVETAAEMASVHVDCSFAKNAALAKTFYDLLLKRPSAAATRVPPWATRVPASLECPAEGAALAEVAAAIAEHGGSPLQLGNAATARGKKHTTEFKDKSGFSTFLLVLAMRNAPGRDKATLEQMVRVLSRG
jgi:hypothetical protein